MLTSHFFVFLEDNLSDMVRVLYDDSAEATSRIAVDMMLIACKFHVMDLHPAKFSPKKQMHSTFSSTQNPELRETLKVYPELDLAVEMMHPVTKERFSITGRADWGFGYNGRDAAHDTFLVAMEAKRRDLFSAAELQLLTYLAIMRELRIRPGKTNTVRKVSMQMVTGIALWLPMRTVMLNVR